MADVNTSIQNTQLPKGFTFFRSYYDSLQFMSDSQQYRFLIGLLGYAFSGEIPSFDDDPTLGLAWVNVKPNVDSSLQKSVDGQKGGRPRKRRTSKSKASPESDAPVPSVPTPYPVNDGDDIYRKYVEDGTMYDADIPF